MRLEDRQIIGRELLHIGVRAHRDLVARLLDVLLVVEHLEVGVPAVEPLRREGADRLQLPLLRRRGLVLERHPVFLRDLLRVGE